MHFYLIFRTGLWFSNSCLNCLVPKTIIDQSVSIIHIQVRSISIIKLLTLPQHETLWPLWPVWPVTHQTICHKSDHQQFSPTRRWIFCTVLQHILVTFPYFWHNMWQYVTNQSISNSWSMEELFNMVKIVISTECWM